MTIPNISALSQHIIKIFIGCELVDISEGDHVFEEEKRGLFVTSTGNVKFQYADGTDLTLPVSVPASGHFELRGHFIKKIYKTGATATVLCGLV